MIAPHTAAPEPIDVTSLIRDQIVDLWGVDAANITPEARLAEDLRADSLDCVELVMAIEDALHLTIHDHETVDVETVAQLIALTERKVREL